MVFPVVTCMWELDYKEISVPKNRCFWTVVLKKTLESPLDCKEIQPVHPKGNQSWIFIRRTDAEAETPILWPPDVKNRLIGKDPDVGKEWSWENGDDRRWDGWMASSKQWTWVWVNSGSWWSTGKPGVLQSMELQRLRHDRATALNSTELTFCALVPGWWSLETVSLKFFTLKFLKADLYYNMRHIYFILSGRQSLDCNYNGVS